MNLRLAAIALSALAFTGAAQAQEVTLRSQIEAAGPAVTLGDVFDNAGAVAARAVAVAPAPGAHMTFSTRFLSAAAAAAGLGWSAPSGVDTITVTRAGASRAQVAAPRAQTIAYSAAPAPVIRRGDVVTLVYVAPGLQLTTRAKATADAALGAPVKLINLQSNRTIDAIATGPQAASASGSQSF